MQSTVKEHPSSAHSVVKLAALAKPYCGKYTSEVKIHAFEWNLTTGKLEADHTMPTFGLYP